MQNVNFIAEVSANHLGSFERAKEIVRAAARAGATSVKFQTYTAATMTLDNDKFKISTNHQLWGGRRLFDLYDEAHTPWEWHKELFSLAREVGVIPFSSPFDISAIEFLEDLDTPMYKIASMETGDLNLIRAAAETGKPLIMSTGATELEEIDDAVACIEKVGNQNLTLLLCTSSYPAQPSDANLNRLGLLRDRYGYKVGLSDHTLGIGVSLAALTLGAVAIEKHLTLNRLDGGADGAFSMEPDEFAMLVAEGINVLESIGDREWKVQASEQESRRLRRSLYVVKDVAKGEVISNENLRAIRPNGGLECKFYDELIGKKFAQDIVAGTPMSANYAE